MTELVRLDLVPEDPHFGIFRNPSSSGQYVDVNELRAWIEEELENDCSVSNQIKLFSKLMELLAPVN